MPPMAPDKPDECGHDHDPDHGIELVEILSQFTPVLSQLHPKPGQSQAPGPRSQECVEMKSSAGHACDPGRQGDKGADHRKQTSHEDGQVSPAGKEAVGPVELAPPHQNPTAVTFD